MSARWSFNDKALSSVIHNARRMTKRCMAWHWRRMEESRKNCEEEEDERDRIRTLHLYTLVVQKVRYNEPLCRPLCVNHGCAAGNRGRGKVATRTSTRWDGRDLSRANKI